MPPLEIGKNWIWEVWGEINWTCNNSGVTAAAAAVTVTVTGVQLILWVFWFLKENKNLKDY